MFRLVEIDKRYDYDGTFVPIEPYVFYSQATNASIADYWTSTFGADGTYNDVSVQINSITLDNVTNLTSKSSYAEMIADDLSFYFDDVNQLLYVNLGQDLNITASSIASGVMYGYCSDTVRYFNKQEYIPIVTSIPNVTENTDPLQYGIISFSSGTVEMANPIIDGAPLFNGKENFYGNTVRILRGNDDDSYDDLITIFNGYISNAMTSTLKETLTLGDNREKLEIDYPTEVFDITSQYELTDDTNGELIPDGYGNVIQAKAYPYRINVGSVTYRWCKKATSISHVYAYQDESLNEVVFNTDTNSPLETGFFYVGDAEAYVDGDNTNGLVDIYVTGRMRDFDNPADIIADLNSNVLGVGYDSSNYNTTEWENEKASLADVALYMNETKSLYEWIEELQGGSNIGFRYEDTNLRTLRLDDKDRTSSTFDDNTTSIEPIDIRNSEIPIDQNAELYASSVIVKYGKNLRTGTYQQVTNSDYYDDVIKEFRVEKIDTYETLLTSQTDAESKASLIAEDESTIRPLIDLTVGSSKYNKPRIFDIIEAEANLLTQGAYQENYTNLLADDDGTLGDDYALGELWGLTYYEASKSGTIEFYGEFTGQVLGISPNIDVDEVMITVRDITDLRS